MKISSGLFTDKDGLVDPFLTDLHAMVLPEPTGSLRWASSLADQRLHQVPGGSSNAISHFAASAQGTLMSLFGVISFLPSVPSQFSADCGFVNPIDMCDLQLFVPRF